MSLQRSSGQKKREKQNSGKCFIVAGTTIGAGMLAMPLAAAGVGLASR
ncbi:hypothetical protein DMI62_19955 [Escherichia coli]|nr:hypothetical protein [Escherichia coli]